MQLKSILPKKEHSRWVYRETIIAEHIAQDPEFPLTLPECPEEEFPEWEKSKNGKRNRRVGISLLENNIK